MSKTACVFGSTGLIGSYVVNILLKDDTYSKIVVFNRLPKATKHPKLEEIVADFNSIHNHTEQLKADEYYCCLGTTIKKAKTKEAFEYVDLELPKIIGKLAVSNKVKKYLVVSSIGASSKSQNFYLKTKGKMEEELHMLDMEKLYFFRPSLLLGKRPESRFAEDFSKIVMKGIGFLFFGRLKKYRAIEAEKVARVMVKIANTQSNQLVFESDEIQAF